MPKPTISAPLLQARVTVPHVVPESAKDKSQVAPPLAALGGKDEFSTHAPRQQSQALMPSAPRTTTEKNLSTHAGRLALWEEWKLMQLTKQLEGARGGSIGINGIRFNGKETRELMRQSVMVAYFQNAGQLRLLSDELREAKLAGDALAMATIGQRIDVVEQSLDELERMSHAKGIMKRWEGKSAQKLEAQIEAANNLFRKMASKELRGLPKALFELPKGWVKAPQELRRELAVLRKKIACERGPYQWSEFSRLVMGSTHRLPEAIVKEFGSSLMPGVIDLESKQGLERCMAYREALQKSVKDHGASMGHLVIAGQIFSPKEALDQLDRILKRTHEDVAKRCLELDGQIRVKVTTYATNCALLQTDSLQKLHQELAPMRKEAAALRALLGNYRGHSELALPNKKLGTLLAMKSPAATHERQAMAQAIQSDTGNHTKQWQFLSATCDSENIDQLFPDLPHKQLAWGLNKTARALPAEDRSDATQQWLKRSINNVAELGKAEWAHRDKLKKFHDWVMDPVFHKLIGDSADKQFLCEAGKFLSLAQKYSTELGLGLDKAIGIPMVNEDYNSNQLAPDLQARLEGKSEAEIETALAKIANVFSLGNFNDISLVSRAILSPDFTGKWNAFAKKHKKTIERYWNLPRNKLLKDDMRGPRAGYNNLAFVPTQRRIATYVAFWGTLHKDAPREYADVLALTHTKVALKAREINRA